MKSDLRYDIITRFLHLHFILNYKQCETGVNKVHLVVEVIRRYMKVYLRNVNIQLLSNSNNYKIKNNKEKANKIYLAIFVIFLVSES